ncbi:hypothetical protein [uncultured Microbacterium sp.]|uniref:hypothetical protein n=1 Tax=uncultured Microbacterium sp. TaxID=191216 RepID=UPI0025E16AAB|nr:hypothetical protein [uncultured Microbacterium sp.]
MRVVLEARSDYAFVGELVETATAWLRDQGLDEDPGADIVAQVLSAPSFAMSADLNGTTTVWHAVVLRRVEDGVPPYELLVRVRATVKKRHFPEGASTAVPAAITAKDLHLDLIDLADDAEVGVLMDHYISMVRELGPMRSARTLPYNILVLGNPHELGCADTPADWQQQLTFLADAFDANITFERGPSVAGVPKNLMCLVRFDPFAGELPRKKKADGSDDQDEIEHTAIEARFTTFKEAFQRICAALNAFEPPQTSDEFTPRDLKPGEKIYHRKIGNAVGYDRFNAGSTESCQHTTEYVRYYNSDKAVKGFKRRYTNFEPSWMHHCKQGGCGMYAVFCPS